MGLREKIINALGGSVVKKTTNSVSGREFLKYGSRQQPLQADWADVRISDEDMYKGYGYAVIQKRGNKVASLAKTNLNTWAKPEVVDEYQKNDETPLHPYLKLIEDSEKFTEKQFYKTISIYLDLAGVYYLGAIRMRKESSNPNLPDIVTDVKEFILLNPYEIRRVVNKDGEIAGYIERKKDGRYREWSKDMIIEMKELNPFDPEKSQWAMTDAAKEAVYTINQSADYTRQSLNGNIDAPGIITTDVLLSDEDFVNFKARVLEHRQGEPLFGNGSGAIKWDSMQVDLDKAALMDINEINRTTLFAVSGTSKTALGIEQSGTTRDTANVQREQLMSDTIQPRLEDIVDFLNLDYRRMYPAEYKKTGYYIEVISAVGRDYATEKAATESRRTQFELYQQIVESGYTEESAKQYASGSIELIDLEEDKERKTETEQPQDDEGDGEDSGSDDSDNNPKEPDNPETPVVEEDNQEGYENIPGTLGKLVKMEKEIPNGTEHNEDCECENKGIEVYENDISAEDSKILVESYENFLNVIREIEKETLRAAENKLTINEFIEKDIISQKKKKSLKDKLKNALKQYWWILVPLFGENAVNQRNNEFGEDYKFRFTNDFKSEVENNAERVAEGHIETILDDVLEVSNNAYTKVVETAAGELIIKAYQANPEKYADYFDRIPTLDEALKAIQNTDILEKNRRIYEKANQMARDGYDRGAITKAIREEYKDISENRATLIARNETSRAFTKSQYEADLQFLNSIGKLQNAYKELYSRSGNPCKYCQALIDKGPIPFTQNFLDKGDEITINSDGKTSTFKADYENIDAGVVHPNCHCAYRLVIKEDKTENDISTSLLNGGANLSCWINNNILNESKEEIRISNGGAGSGNFGHSGRPGKIGGSGSGGPGDGNFGNKPEEESITPKVVEIIEKTGADATTSLMIEEYPDEVVKGLYNNIKSLADLSDKRLKEIHDRRRQMYASEEEFIKANNVLITAISNGTPIQQIAKNLDVNMSKEIVLSKQIMRQKGEVIGFRNQDNPEFNHEGESRWGDMPNTYSSSGKQFRATINAENILIHPEVLYSADFSTSGKHYRGEREYIVDNSKIKLLDIEG